MKKFLTVVLVLSIIGALFTGLYPVSASAEGDEYPYYEYYLSTKLTGFSVWGAIAKTGDMPLGMTMGNKGTITNSATGTLTFSPSKATSGNIFTALSPLSTETPPTGTTSLAGNPMTVAETGSPDLSEYDGVRFQINSKSLTQTITLTIGAVGTDHDFMASAKFKYSDREQEANNNIYLLFDIPATAEDKGKYKYFVNDSDASVGITAEQLKEVNYISINAGRTTVATAFMMLSDLACFKSEGGVPYTKIMSESASKRWAEYTSPTWKAFKEVYNSAYKATSVTAREEASVALNQRVQELVPISISSYKLPGFDNWTEEDLVKSHVENGTMKLINDAATVEKFGGTGAKQVLKVTGNNTDDFTFQNYRPNTTSFTRMPADPFGGISHTGYTGIRVYISSDDYTKFARYDGSTKTSTGFAFTLGGNADITEAAENSITIDASGKGDQYTFDFTGAGYVYIPFSSLTGDMEMPNPGYIFKLRVILPSSGATIYISNLEYYKKETNDNAVDLSALAELIGQAQEIEEFDYSDTSLKAMRKVLLAAQSTFNSMSATEAQVATAVVNLRNAINALEKGEVKYVKLNSFVNWTDIEESPGIVLENARALISEDKAFIATGSDFGIRFKLNRGKTNFNFASYNGNAVYKNPFGKEFEYISGIRMYISIENEAYAKGKYIQLSLVNVNYTWKSANVNSTKAYNGPGWYYWQISDMELAEKYIELKGTNATQEEQRENELAILSGSHKMIAAPDAFNLSVNVSGSTSIYVSSLEAYQKLDVNGNPEGMEYNSSTGDTRNLLLPLIFILIALASASALAGMRTGKKKTR